MKSMKKHGRIIKGERSSLPLSIIKLLLNHKVRWQFSLYKKAVWSLIHIAYKLVF